MEIFRKWFIKGSVAALLSSVLVAEPSLPDAKNEPEEQVAVVTEKEIKLPGVTIDRKTREVRIEAVACLEEGILEYVVCRPNTFEHEAIFTTEAKPEMVHAALLLCGLKPTPQLAGLAELWFDKALKRKESRVRIEVEWEKEGKKNRVDLSTILRNRKEDSEKKVEDAWVFAGSFLQPHPETGKSFYAANGTGILVGIWPDPSTVIQYGVASGNPYEAKNYGMEINGEKALELGTKVNLVFSRMRLPEEGPAKQEPGED